MRSPWRSATAGSARTCRTPSAFRSAPTPRLRAPRGEGERRGGDRGRSSPRRCYKLKVARARASRTIRTTPRASSCSGRSMPAPTGQDRTSLVMSAENKPGAVHALLTPIAEPRRQHDAHRVAAARRRARRCGSTCSSSTSKAISRTPAVAARDRRAEGAAPFLKVLGSYPVAG